MQRAAPLVARCPPVGPQVSVLTNVYCRRRPDGRRPTDDAGGRGASHCCCCCGAHTRCFNDAICARFALPAVGSKLKLTGCCVYHDVLVARSPYAAYVVGGRERLRDEHTGTDRTLRRGALPRKLSSGGARTTRCQHRCMRRKKELAEAMNSRHVGFDAYFCISAVGEENRHYCEYSLKCCACMHDREARYEQYLLECLSGEYHDIVDCKSGKPRRESNSVRVDCGRYR
jgi:hypothetical protein